MRVDKRGGESVSGAVFVFHSITQTPPPAILKSSCYAGEDFSERDAHMLCCHRSMGTHAEACSCFRYMFLSFSGSTDMEDFVHFENKQTNKETEIHRFFHISAWMY